TRLEVWDTARERVPVGVPGELWIGGVQVADGYVGEPSLTAERFVDGWYRTGDRARWLPSGEIEYLGRLDEQVKIRGQRIEPGEIEAAIVAQPEATAAAVVARADGGATRLVAYVVSDAFAGVDWRARLRERLPEFMLPAVFVRLDALPLTVNGKLDRAALPAPTATDVSAAAAPFTAPAGPAERAVADAYAAVLGVEPDAIGAHDAFFALGGDSLNSLALVAQLREQGYEVALADVFLHQTVRELAAAAVPAVAVEETAEDAFGMVDAADLARLSARFGGNAS
ncbi:phosphopantetheine-binding protein, partial [Virgisporangium aurantiacum]|uniref:phosphopantetheine-binding protein n=1 Tax=Virgisporangium aurantiacum TaxID=175570 RepID=UPI001951AE92